ncbi:hypothetical protein [Campylobacter concisus]|uniref:hypothetical protein n=1 Tax=Campylobacter concisus TaxID=199 RepID=UPI001CB7B7B0|nr:hypothetical protein [Campylobacter concisus]
MQIFDTANLLSTMLPVFFSFALPIIIFVILVNLITKFIRRKLRQKSYVKFNQRNIADTFSAKEIAKKFDKNAKDVNEVLLNLGFIKKCDNGYNVTDVGRYYGGMQNFYMGKASVRWDERLLCNENFINEIVKVGEISSKKEQKEDFREKFKAEYRTNDGHYVRSMAELVIANWLFAEGIAYAYEKRVPIEEDMYCDFYIPKGKVYIEFWGLKDDEAYLERKEKKIELYKKYNLNLIEIDNNTINKIDDYLPKELLKFGVSLNL